MKKVVIVEDDEFSRNGVVDYLKSKGFIIWESADRETAWQLITTKQPDIAIIDISIPINSTTPVDKGSQEGVKLVLQVKQAYPEIGVVVFSAYQDRGKALFELVQTGTRGIAYLIKGITQPSTFLKAIADVQNGKVVLNPQDMDMDELEKVLEKTLSEEERPWVTYAKSHIVSLTRRENEVAQRIAASHSSQSIAKALILAPKTVENYISRVYSKLGFQTMAQDMPHLRQSIILAKAFMLYEISMYRV